jgi:hypothetical protein
MDHSKDDAIKALEHAHSYFKEILHEFTENQILEKQKNGWSIKDVIAHLSGWNIEYVDEINRIFHDETLWNKEYATEEGDAAFNKLQVEKRKELSWNEVEKEWDETYLTLIQRVKALTDEEWNHAARGEFWTVSQEPALLGKPVTVRSLFFYEIQGRPHELSHAESVAKLLKD